MQHLTSTLPASAYHATRYADWTFASYCLWPRATRCRSLPEVERRKLVARASSYAGKLALLPRYSLPDTYNVPAYARQRQPLPALPDWQVACLEAVRHMRRWRYYSDSPA